MFKLPRVSKRMALQLGTVCLVLFILIFLWPLIRETSHLLDHGRLIRIVPVGTSECPNNHVCVQARSGQVFALDNSFLSRKDIGQLDASIALEAPLCLERKPEGLRVNWRCE
jgi:hypothetical protein